jgi:hypothetical protein
MSGLSTEIPAADDADLVWGADAIGNVIGRTARQVDHLLHKGLLPARKFGGRWVSSRKSFSRPSSAMTDDAPNTNSAHEKNAPPKRGPKEKAHLHAYNRRSRSCAQ